MTRSVIYAILGLAMVIRGGYLLLTSDSVPQNLSPVYQLGSGIGAILFLVVGLFFLLRAVINYRKRGEHIQRKASKKRSAEDFFKEVSEEIAKNQRVESKEGEPKQNNITLD